MHLIMRVKDSKAIKRIRDQVEAAAVDCRETALVEIEGCFYAIRVTASTAELDSIDILGTQMSDEGPDFCVVLIRKDSSIVAIGAHLGY